MNTSSSRTLFSKNNSRIRNVFLASGILFMMASCEQVMHINLSGSSDPELVVSGSITTDTTAHCVVLSYTADYFEKPAQIMATGAQVTITDGTEIFPLTEKEDGKYYTDSDVYGIPGKMYTLNVTLANGQEYSASDNLRPCASFDSISESQNYNTYLNGYGYDVLFYGQEPEPAGDYYLYDLYLDHVLYTDTITEVTIASDEFVNGRYVRDFPVLRIRENDMQSPSTLVTLAMSSITKNYYDYLTALFTETAWRGSPWDGPPANVPGNISNGGWGFFNASAIKRKSRVFTPLPRAD